MEIQNYDDSDNGGTGGKNHMIRVEERKDTGRQKREIMVAVEIWEKDNGIEYSRWRGKNCLIIRMMVITEL